MANLYMHIRYRAESNVWSWQSSEDPKECCCWLFFSPASRYHWTQYALSAPRPFAPSTRNFINFWWIKVMAAVSAINYTNRINLDWITTPSHLIFCLLLVSPACICVGLLWSLCRNSMTAAALRLLRVKRSISALNGKNVVWSYSWAIFKVFLGFAVVVVCILLKCAILSVLLLLRRKFHVICHKYLTRRGNKEYSVGKEEKPICYDIF